jgi:hypothetical protein
MIILFLQAKSLGVVQDCLQPLEASMNPLYSEEDLQWVTRTWGRDVIWRLPGT